MVVIIMAIFKRLSQLTSRQSWKVISRPNTIHHIKNKNVNHCYDTCHVMLEEDLKKWSWMNGKLHTRKADIPGSWRSMQSLYSDPLQALKREPLIILDSQQKGLNFCVRSTTCWPVTTGVYRTIVHAVRPGQKVNIHWATTLRQLAFLKKTIGISTGNRKRQRCT